MAEETCAICGNKIEIQIMKNSGVCSELCRKVRDGELSRAEIDPSLTMETGGVDPRGIV